MKSKSILLPLALMMLVINLGACAQNNNSESGSTKNIVKNYSIETFTEIKSEIVGNIIFTQGEQATIRTEGTQAEIDNIEVTFADGKLTLQSKKKKEKGKSRLYIYITAPVITKIDHEGVGTLTLKDKVKLQNLEIEYEGVGNLTTDNLECENIKVEYKGVGNLKLNGSAVNAEFKSEGVGNISAQDFNTEHLVVKASGVGKIKCRASKTIDISSDGVGGVTYWGDAEVINLNKSGIGKIAKGK